MEDYNNIIEGILYLKGDEGIDIKELSLILEISKKEEKTLERSLLASMRKAWSLPMNIV